MFGNEWVHPVFVCWVFESSLAPVFCEQQPLLPWQSHGLMALSSVLTISTAPTVTEAICPCHNLQHPPSELLPLKNAFVLFFCPFILCLLSSSFPFLPLSSSLLFLWQSTVPIITTQPEKLSPVYVKNAGFLLIYIVNARTNISTWGMVISISI